MDLETYLRTSEVNKAEFAAKVGVSPSMVSQWLSGHRPIAPRRALRIDEVTGGKVSKHDLCPDVYPREPFNRENAGNGRRRAVTG